MPRYTFMKTDGFNLGETVTIMASSEEDARKGLRFNLCWTLISVPSASANEQCPDCGISGYSRTTGCAKPFQCSGA